MKFVSFIKTPVMYPTSLTSMLTIAGCTYHLGSSIIAQSLGSTSLFDWHPIKRIKLINIGVNCIFFIVIYRYLLIV